MRLNTIHMRTQDSISHEYPDAKPEDRTAELETKETVEQISKDIAVGTKEISYEDGRNVISVIINAISVRINMPRGTVKTLAACFAVLLVAASIYGINVLRDWSTAYYETAEYQKSVDTIKYGVIDAADTVTDADLTRNVVFPEKEVVISENYSFTVPAGYFNEYSYGYGGMFMNMQSFGFYNDAGDYYVVRSYITKEGIEDKDLKGVVIARLADATDVKNVRYDYEDFEYGPLIACRYEAAEEEEPDIYAVEYSWQDDDGTICSLDISAESGDYEETAKRILSSVRRSRNGFTNDELIEREKELYYGDYDPDDPVGMGEVDPYAAMEPDIDEIRKQEAMEAWEEYNRPEQDISDRIIKP